MISPLYMACRRKAPVEVVRMLLDAYPEAVKMKGGYNEFPIHVACDSEAPVEAY